MATNSHLVIEKGSSCALLKFWALEAGSKGKIRKIKRHRSIVGRQRNIQQNSPDSLGVPNKSNHPLIFRPGFDRPSEPARIDLQGEGGWKYVGVGPTRGFSRYRDHVLPIRGVNNSQYSVVVLL